jgi:hypothetical protein
MSLLSLSSSLLVSVVGRAADLARFRLPPALLTPDLLLLLDLGSDLGDFRAFGNLFVFLPLRVGLVLG